MQYINLSERDESNIYLLDYYKCATIINTYKNTTKNNFSPNKRIYTILSKKIEILTLYSIHLYYYILYLK